MDRFATKDYLGRRWYNCSLVIGAGLEASAAVVAETGALFAGPAVVAVVR